ncbi:GMC family oxidoreductase [Myxococcota bacterium]|nr:GMC family oxidoreductase [Myxococcota bacterium]
MTENRLHPELPPFLMALGEVLMPSSAGMLGYNEASLGRFEGWLEALKPSTAKGLVWAMRAMRRRIGGLWLPQTHAGWKQAIHRYLERQNHHNLLDRQAFRAISLPLKVRHYESKEAYSSAGLTYSAAQPFAAIHEKPDGTITDIAELRALEEMELDAIIVGSGAGGAVMAHALASAGWSVLVVEEGAYYHRKTFLASSSDISLHLYQNQGMAFALGDPPIYLPTGRSVGGTTTVNSGTCYRPPHGILEEWQAMGLEQWGSEQLAPHFAQVEAALGVAPAQAAYLGKAGSVIAQGSERMGYIHRPLLRNAPECDGQGRCAFGCPTEAKRSTNTSYIPMALKKGAYIAPQTRLTAIFGEASAQNTQRIRKAQLLHLPTQTTVTLPCKHLILAAGTLRTPYLLKAAGVQNAWLGRNLSIHPAVSVLAEFDQPSSLQAIPQGYAVESFHEQGLLFEGGTVPLEILAGASSLWGDALQSQMAAYPRLAHFGFMVRDKGRGRLLPSLNGQPTVHYQLSPQDARKIHRGFEILAGIYLAAGAKQVWPQMHAGPSLRSFRDLRAFAASPLPASHIDISAYHPLGTARLGRTPDKGVVDPQGRVFGWQGLYVADGSILPSSPAVNPQITIMAAASHIASMMSQA